MSQPPADASPAAAVGLLDALGLETGLVAAGALVVLLIGRLVLRRLVRARRLSPFVQHSVLVGLTAVALVGVALTLKPPVDEQVLKFLGLAFSVVVAFSSTTLVGNGLAGIMLRTQSHFRGGDWLSVGELFGQVSHRGLFFTTVQSELRDLVTLPNLYLATHPVTVVVRPTYISAEVSLGYDVPRSEIERLLVEAATSTGLDRAFVYVLELGDYSVLYRVSGKLVKTDELLTMKSNLRGRVLDALHAGGIEIVSPAFMNQRVLPQGRRFIPAATGAAEPEPPAGPAPEADTFDKSRLAKAIEQLEDALRAAEERKAGLREELGSCDSEERKAALERDLEKLERGRERLIAEIDQRRAEAAAAR
jgi:small-conductance mechanosensitive channel